MIYFDNVASTKVCDEAIAEMNIMNSDIYANAGSTSGAGFEAEMKIRDAKTKIASGLNINLDELYITSGATESNNWAVFGISEANRKKGNHIISQHTEHPSVRASVLELENRGFEVTMLGVDSNGRINLDELKEAIKPSTILVSIMQINNETGVRMQTKEIGEIVKSANENIVYHVDGVQGFGKYDIDLKECNVDAYSFSSHKIHGPKGIGGLFIRRGVNIKPLLYGGSQQNGYRPGTPNSTGIVGFGAAYESAKNHKTKEENARQVKEILMSVKDELDGVYINGDVDNASNFVLNMSFEGVRGETLLHALGEREIYVSEGAACNGNGQRTVLNYYGYSSDRVMSSVRFGISRYSTVEEARITKEAIKEIVPMLRKIVRR